MGSAADILDRRRDFPATAVPCPIVLVDHYLRVLSGGFESGASKMAFVQGVEPINPSAAAPAQR